MKALKITVAALAAASLVVSACGQNKKVAGVEAELPSKALVDSASYLVGINFGYFIKSNGFEDLNEAQIKAGIKDFLKAKGNINSEEFNNNFKVSPDLMNDILGKYVEMVTAYKAEAGKKAGENFLEANGKKDGIVTTDSGLQYKIIEEGSDVKPGPQDTVYVHYKGTLIDGTQFDASDPEKDPVQLTLDRVIKGWTEGIQLIGEGGKIQLFVPAELGYGERGMGDITPNSVLIFDVELVKVGKAPVQEEVAEDAEVVPAK